MITLKEVIETQIRSTKALFIEEFRKEPEEAKELFIEWYFLKHEAPKIVLINDISEYYLDITEDEIIKNLNKNERL